jgi:predicted nucleic acid-binding Zn ribbon protein
MQKQPKGVLVNLQTKPRHTSKSHTSNKTPKAAEATKTTESKGNNPQVVEMVQPEPKENTWLAKTRRQLAQVAKEIQADMDFHDTEGLEAFSPDALEQVKTLRGDMNGPTAVTR